MTEARRQSRAGAGYAAVFWSAVALFTVLFALLTYQLSSSTPAPPRPVLVRKVVKKRVVTTVVPTPGATTISSGPVVGAGEPEYAAPPVTTGAS